MLFPHHHHAGFRSRKTLAEHFFWTYGYRLAMVNPLRRDGFMDSRRIEFAFPKMMRPLVQQLMDARNNEQQQPGNNFVPPLLRGSEEEPLIRDLVTKYCNTGIGYEFMHCATDEERHFFIDAIEQDKNYMTTMNDPLMHFCVEQITRANAWEHLIATRYPTSKRFSLEGLESTVLALNTILDTFANENQELNNHPRVVLSSMHRGRVNLLHTLLQNKIDCLLRQWDKTDGPTYDDICQGHSAYITTKCGKAIHMILMAMPAHLESQDAAVAGFARGHMTAHVLAADETCKSTTHSFPVEMDEHVGRSVLPVALHGDASFCGEGIVSETFQLSTFSGYDCWGTVHIILNNQVGFTAETQNMRTARHAFVNVSDIAHSIRAPVLHVNAERPLDVFKAARLTTQYRQRFGKDIVMDLWGYRRHGHNEVDDPRITNVSLYKEVDRHPPISQVFLESMPATQRQKYEPMVKGIENEYKNRPNTKQDSDYIIDCEASLVDTSSEWIHLWSNTDTARSNTTGATKQDITRALDIMTNIPEGMVLSQPTLRAVSRRAELLTFLQQKSFDSNQCRIDWATAELLSLATLANEGHYCRLSGQDSQRGTFSQRHAVWHDAITGQTHHALPALVQVLDSPLSELGVLGFEHGMSLASPNYLVLWEAQFGDFVNNGQVLIDTMICSEKEKFGLESNLVLLLPHGYDGMGAEHSSCRLERFLSLHTDTPAKAQTQTDLDRLREANFTVIYPSTPANYFHVLRRSFTWPFRRPMVVLTPKRTLRLPAATSPVCDILMDSSCSVSSMSRFSPILDDPRSLSHKSVKSILICTGELFYDVLQLAKDSITLEESESVAILRVEQLAPFPFRELQCVVRRYQRARRLAWMQEEPRNMGAHAFVTPFLTALSQSLSGLVLHDTLSRPVSAAPAVGIPEEHRRSQQQLYADITEWIRQT